MLAEVVASVRRVAVSWAVVWPLGRTVAVGDAGDGDGRDDGDGLRAVVDDAADGDFGALIGDRGPCG